MRLNLSTVFENHLKCLIFHQFLSYKIDLSGNTVNLARFARNIECDYFWQFSNTVLECDFA